MAGSKGNTLELQMLDAVLGKVTYTAPTTLYAALYTAAPTSAGGGTEVSGGSYARASGTNNLTNWPAASGGGPGSKSNGTAVTFPTASGSWGTVAAFGIFDASSGGNLLYWGTLNTPRAVASGDTPSFAIGALVVTET
jgi:hypothetical protein